MTNVNPYTRSQPQRPTFGANPKPDSRVIDSLLSRLSSDDAFREKFLGNPAAALAEFGIEVDAESIPSVRRLPSKDALRSERDVLRSALSDDWPEWSFLLRG